MARASVWEGGEWGGSKDCLLEEITQVQAQAQCTEQPRALRGEQWDAGGGSRLWWLRHRQGKEAGLHPEDLGHHGS